MYICGTTKITDNYKEITANTEKKSISQYIIKTSVAKEKKTRVKSEINK